MVFRHFSYCCYKPTIHCVPARKRIYYMSAELLSIGKDDVKKTEFFFFGRGGRKGEKTLGIGMGEVSPDQIRLPVHACVLK